MNALVSIISLVVATVARLTMFAQIMAVAVLTAVLIAVQHGRIVGFGQMDPAVQTFLYAAIAAVAVFVSLVQQSILDGDPFGILLDAWTKLVGIVAVVLAAWMGLSGESVDLKPYLYLFVLLALVVVLLIVVAAAHAWHKGRPDEDGCT